MDPNNNRSRFRRSSAAMLTSLMFAVVGFAASPGAGAQLLPDTELAPEPPKLPGGDCEHHIEMEDIPLPCWQPIPIPVPNSTPIVNQVDNAVRQVDEASKDCPLLGTGCETWMARYGQAPQLESVATEFNGAHAVATSGSLVFMAGQTSYNWPLSQMDVFVAAYDGITGAHQWTTTYEDVPFLSKVHLSPASATELIVAWDNQVHALDSSTGSESWDSTMSGIIMGLEVIPTGTSVAVLAQDRSTGITVSLLDASSGSTTWSSSVASPGNDLFIQPVMSPLAASSDHVYVTAGWSASSSLVFTQNRFATFAYDVSTGSQEWDKTFRPGTSTWPRVTVTDGSAVYVTGMSWSSLDFTGFTPVSMETVAYNGATGAILWSARHNSVDATWDRPVAMELSGDRLFLLADAMVQGGSSRTTTLAYDTASGNAVWVTGFKSPVGDRMTPADLTVSNDRVFIASTSKVTVFPGAQHSAFSVEANIVAYESTTGNPRTWMRETGSVSTALASHGGRVFLAGTDQATGAVLAAYPNSISAGPPVVPIPVVPV